MTLEKKETTQEEEFDDMSKKQETPKFENKIYPVRFNK